MMAEKILLLLRKMGRGIPFYHWRMKNPREKVSLKVLLVGDNEFIHKLNDAKVNFVVVRKSRVVPTSTIFDDLLVEIQYLLNEHVDIVVDDFPNEFPLVTSISHRIDLIPGASFPN